MTRAGVYVRISRDREGLAAGVERQEADCRALAEQRGWEVAEVYSDNDVSASDYRKNRPAYRRMLQDLREGRIDAIVAYSSSRLYRRLRDLIELVELVKERHVEIASVASGRIDLSTADGRMLAGILASVDQAEAERIGERSTRARAELKADGRWTGGGAPAFGYERLKDARGKVTHRIREDEAAVLRDVVRRALAGEPLTRIVRDLNDRGVTTSKGRRWQPSNLRNTITSPFHAGIWPDGTSGDWPAIISKDEHRLLRARFPKRTGAGRGQGDRSAQRRYRLSGLAYCSECGKKLLGSGGAYRCQLRNGGCGRVRMAAHLLDAYVEEQAFTRDEVKATDPARDWKNLEDVPSTPDPADDILVAELHAIEARRHDLAEDYASGDLSREDYRVATEALARRTGEVEARIREEAPKRRVSYSALLEEPDNREWNAFLEQFIERIDVRPAVKVGRGATRYVPDRVRITWRQGVRERG